MKASSSIHKALDSITTNSAYEHILEQINATSSIHKAMDSLAASCAYAKTIAALSSSSSLQRTFDAISSTGSFRAALVSLAIPANLQAAMVGFDFEAAGIPRQENQIAEQIDDLAKAEESSDFLRLFRQIPTAIQVIMLFMVLQILLPIINSVTANIVTPYVEAIVANSVKPRRELVKAIASTRIEDLDLSQHRFVTVEVLHLREQPSTKSQILDDLQLGQVLTVVSRERNWMEVAYTHEDGEIMQGWVFARYAAKFKP